MNNHFVISGQLVDILKKQISPSRIEIEDGIISRITELPEAPPHYILPGFIDAHVHIESSMLVPSEFARMAVVHGTIGTVSDPHEIANVCGMDGIRFMIYNGKQVPFHFNFGAPSCVPATAFETAGAEITAADIDLLLKSDEIKYLAEMMNWPGILFNDADVYEKLAIARKHGKPVDGHAPGLIGERAAKYVSAGISTDHECFTYEEALDKLKLGMKILIREGSAAKNFDALISLLNDYEDQMMFCSDDKHPDNLLLGHINDLVKSALANGVDIFKALKAACINPVLHYKLDSGLLSEGDSADFIVVDNLKKLNVLSTYVKGQLVAEKGKSAIQSVSTGPINNFNCRKLTIDAIRLSGDSADVWAIEALDGQLITNKVRAKALIHEGNLISNQAEDVLKIVVVNRYKSSKPAIGFIKNFGLKDGAIASSIAHDSHNIIAVGSSDDLILKALNEIIDCEGGITALSQTSAKTLPLPVAGIMTTEDGFKVAELYTEIDRFAKSLGSALNSPFMTLSFMALLVIPSLKLSDLGLFDGDNFSFTDLHCS